MQRRKFIKTGLILAGTGTAASVFKPAGAAARDNILNGGKLWKAKETPPPTPADPTKRLYLTKQEYAQITAIFDRLIPADELTVSASDAGCVVFIDNQLAGSYGKASWRYNVGPFENGTTSQGNQQPYTPAQIYRIGLAEIEKDCQSQFSKSFSELTNDQQDKYLEQMEADQINYPTLSSKELFSQFLSNVQEGFLADPIYGGNRNMIGWKMIGFPGARYDYRDYAPLKGTQLTIEPVSIIQLLKA